VPWPDCPEIATTLVLPQAREKEGQPTIKGGKTIHHRQFPPSPSSPYLFGVWETSRLGAARLLCWCTGPSSRGALGAVPSEPTRPLRQAVAVGVCSGAYSGHHYNCSDDSRLLSISSPRFRGPITIRATTSATGATPTLSASFG
jgi:hypothetical protein